MTGLLALVALALFKTGLDMSAAYRQSGIAACLGSAHPNSNCPVVINAFQNTFGQLNSYSGWLNFLPLIFALLFGLPLVLELEQGTHRLAWTQSITRSQWITVKLCFIVAATLLASMAFTLLMTWWRTPWDHIEGRFGANAFGFEGTAPLSYALFAVALAICLGTLLRRTLPAVALAFIVYLAARLGVENQFRPSFVAPVKVISGFDKKGGAGVVPRNAWELASGWSDRTGHILQDNFIFQSCPPSLGGKNSIEGCFRAHHFMNYLLYQPANRYWFFQGIETALFTGVAALLLAFTVWWIRYRLS